MPTFLIVLVFMATITGSACVTLALRHYRRKVNSYLEYLPRHIWNSISLQKLIDSTVPLPPPTGWAADSDLLVELSRMVACEKPKTIIELGSGLSTIVIAATLRENGSGSLISIDHDPGYAELTRQQLLVARLTAEVKVVVAPLVKQIPGSASAVWYDLTDTPLPQSIDLVFVDGPPATLDREIRSRALEYFWPRLNFDGSIVLDDANRPGEKNFIDQWLLRHPEASIRRLQTLKGCAIISRPAE